MDAIVLEMSKVTRCEQGSRVMCGQFKWRCELMASSVYWTHSSGLSSCAGNWSVRFKIPSAN